MPEKLVEKLSSQNYSPLTLTSSSGGRLIILPFGARIIGAFAPQSSENAFWVNDALFDRKKFLENPKWKNSGGERTWLAPERELFIADLNRPSDTYVVPEAFDPGNYRVLEQTNSKAVLATDADVVSLLTGEKAKVQIQKEIQILDDRESLAYRQTTTLKYLSDPKNLKLNLWHLAQLPAPGKILIGTKSKSSYRTYFGQDNPTRVEIKDRCISFGVTADEGHKIGVKAERLTGKIDFLRELKNDLCMLFSKSITVDPAGEYIDTPWNAPDDTGYAVQCYNDDGTYGNFGELEYHTPAIGGSIPRTEYRDMCTVRLRIAPKSQILDRLP
jgi:hypothetical protein